MSFQSSVAIKQGFAVPGEIFQDVPWVVLSWTLNSSGTPNVVGATAYTITSEGYAQAGNGGTLGFAGILCAPKDFALPNASLAPTLTIPDETQAELITQGMLAVTLPNSANIGDFIIYDNTTGELSSMAPSDIVPTGFTFANAIVSQFTQSISGSGLAIIQIETAFGAAAAGGHWPYDFTLWGTTNGLNSNVGNNIDLPKLTMQGLFDAVNTPDPWTINIPDAGTYDCQVVNTTQPDRSAQVFVNAPGATLSNNANLELFDPRIIRLYVNAGVLSSFGGPAVIQVGDNSYHIYRAQAVEGSIELSAIGARLYLTADSITNSTISVPDGAEMFVNITNVANPSSVTVLNPKNVYGKIGNRFYPSSGSAVFTPVEASAGTITAEAGKEYLAVNSGLLQTFNFPDNTSTTPPVVGDKIKINGVSSSPWVAVFGAGVACFYGSTPTSPGGNISATAPTDLAEFMYIQNNVWTVEFTNPGAVLVPA